MSQCRGGGKRGTRDRQGLGVGAAGWGWGCTEFTGLPSRSPTQTRSCPVASSLCQATGGIVWRSQPGREQPGGSVVAQGPAWWPRLPPPCSGDGKGQPAMAYALCCPASRWAALGCVGVCVRSVNGPLVITSVSLSLSPSRGDTDAIACHLQHRPPGWAPRSDRRCWQSCSRLCHCPATRPWSCPLCQHAWVLWQCVCPPCLSRHCPFIFVPPCIFPRLFPVSFPSVCPLVCVFSLMSVLPCLSVPVPPCLCPRARPRSL